MIVTKDQIRQIEQCNQMLADVVRFFDSKVPARVPHGELGPRNVAFDAIKTGCADDVE